MRKQRKNANCFPWEIRGAVGLVLQSQSLEGMQIIYMELQITQREGGHNISKRSSQILVRLSYKDTAHVPFKAHQGVEVDKLHFTISVCLITSSPSQHSMGIGSTQG